MEQSFPSLFFSFTWIIFVFLFRCHVIFLFVFSRALSFLCPLFFSSNFFFFTKGCVDFSSVPSSESSFSSFPIFYPSPYQPCIFFCSHLLFCPSLTLLFNPLLLTLFFRIRVYVCIHKPMCSYLQSFPRGVCSHMYQQCSALHVLCIYLSLRKNFPDV